MRVVDIDRDMSDVIPTGTTRDSQYLFDRMTERTRPAAPAAGCRARCRERFRPGHLGCSRSVARPPSAPSLAADAGLGAARRCEAGRSDAAAQGGALSEGTGPGTAVIAPGASARTRPDPLCRPGVIDFHLPTRASMPRAARARSITSISPSARSPRWRGSRGGGRVVLRSPTSTRWPAASHTRSTPCARIGSGVRRGGRRHYDVPADHFTRYEVPLMRAGGAPLDIERVEGISPRGDYPVTRTVESLPAGGPTSRCGLG